MSRLFLITFLLCVAWPTGAAPAPLNLYVSLEGYDAWSGRYPAPTPSAPAVMSRRCRSGEDAAGTGHRMIGVAIGCRQCRR